MLSRRGFINTTLGAGAAFAAQGAQSGSAQAPAAQAVRKRLIVDSQVHLWKAETADWKWVPGMTPQLPEPFTIEKLVPLMTEGGVDRVVVVPPSWPGDRNDYGLEAARRYPDRLHVMGRVTLTDPKQAELLPKWKEQPGMLGVRVTFTRLAGAAGWLSDGTADWFWPAAEKAGLPVMFLAPGKLQAFAKIAERHPQLGLVIDHMALSPEIAKAGKIAEALTDTVAMAKYSNVSIKLSSSPLYSSQAYPFRDMTVHLERCYDTFGPRRCHWGTDITNSYDKATYRQRITHFTETLDFLSEDDKDWIMGRAIVAKLGWA